MIQNPRAWNGANTRPKRPVSKPLTKARSHGLWEIRKHDSAARWILAIIGIRTLVT